ncbi:MAG: DUF4097 family beta strand repeat protein [Candidatus Aminicenantes bacterium]|nr:DUF4097 family beta strand repeat protein [Candidatus Aminicenantes bacterium]
MKAKEIILLIFIIAAGVFAYHVQSGKIDFTWDDVFAFDFNEFTYEETQVIEPPFPEALRVLNAHGKVDVQGTDTDRIRFTFVKRIRRQNEEKAREIADRLHPVVTRGESAVTVATNRKDFRRRNFNTDFRITVPAGMPLEVTNSYGPVRADRVGETSIANRHGEVTVTDIQGGLVVENSYEDVEISGIPSNCTVRSRHADIKARSVEGEMNIENSYGLVDVRGVHQSVTVTGPHCEIIGENLPGPAEIRNSYEKVTLRNVGPVRIDGHHSSIEASEVSGDVEIIDAYASVRLTALGGDLRLDGKHVEVSGRDIRSEDIFISSTYEDIELAGFSGKTTIILSHGNITLTPRAITGPLEVRATYAPITLFWPGDARFPFEAQTRSSDIHWRLPGDLTIERTNGLTTAKGFSGAPRILLFTTYGDIRVEPGPNS